MSSMTKFIGGSAVFGQRVSNVETAVDALIGIPMPWAGATPPTNHLLLNGAAFNKTTYPKLAAVYPSGVLPDMRGEFIRGWDNGRGVDASRALLSAQTDAMQKITGGFYDMTGGPNVGVGVGAFAISVLTANLQQLPQTGNYKQVNIDFDSSRVARTASENRPRSVAFNYIVRAA